MEVNNQEEKLDFSEGKNPDFLTEDHSKYNFGEPESSSVLKENGDIHDAGFRVQSGKVSYDKISDGLYLTSFRKDDGTIEKREVSLEVLSNWFYAPTDKYYEEVVMLIEVHND